VIQKKKTHRSPGGPLRPREIKCSPKETEEKGQSMIRILFPEEGRKFERDPGSIKRANQEERECRLRAAAAKTFNVSPEEKYWPNITQAIEGKEGEGGASWLSHRHWQPKEGVKDRQERLRGILFLRTKRERKEGKQTISRDRQAELKVGTTSGGSSL